ncbi:putative F-box/LRR-repeat protein At1g56400 [Lotus japonicus]|uniref:putative F-box/LRR-repeat protein At1g56400 n=1 Tax=Lotus japonicus TaxID=34305 RepID=UPI0025865B09|nr:putative F-box/LRR-repeat protein At1g56400 [Lotus japonicus]
MAPNTDRLSSLPHSLLKEAIRTSILSKSWIDIFKSTSNIEFDEVSFVKDSQTYRNKQAQRKAFLNFVALWIANHSETIVDKFSLRFSMPEKAKRVVGKCISFATNHGVKELELNFCDPTLNCYFTTNYINQEALHELPTHVYGHTFVKSLKLFSCGFVEAEFHNFHALKEISLGWMEVKLNTTKTLLLNCKALESLSLKRCWNSDEFNLGEENLRLRKLVVDRCMFRSDSIYFTANAPNLRYFYYSGLNNNFLVIDARSLVMEEFILDFCIEFEGHALFLYKLVEKISSASVLTVSNYLLQDYELPENFNPERFWTDHERASTCMLYTLRYVDIKNFEGSINEIRMLTYFITMGRILRKITINVLKDDVADQDDKLDYYRSDMTEQLMTQRASKDLEISML